MNISAFEVAIDHLDVRELVMESSGNVVFHDFFPKGFLVFGLLLLDIDIFLEPENRL